MQANELGIHAVGYDVSAFNVMLCPAKTEVYDLSRTRWEVFDALAQTERLLTRRKGQLSQK